ncbi:GTP cyclohydrolase FolE2 [Isoalcanivorax beigongshangi]|uniref:GTP cyclohydrolase FolE2 n=1 Tax=Isoalcanivorax beigongshangi TaxID=3238810 RepID=A0ABV4ADZ2_9GAMM
MERVNAPTPAMPDVASASHQRVGPKLDWVGMSEIHLPTQVSDTIHGERPVAASIQAYVNLQDVNARGIHMSRLFLMLEETFGEASVNMGSLRTLLANFLDTHGPLSSRAFVELAFDFSIRRPALLSQYAGWRSYPVRIAATLEGDQLDVELAVDVLYSSTCPCSAALARQLIQNAFQERFGSEGSVSLDDAVAWLGTEQGIVATPHSQRSVAQLKVKLDAADGDALPITALIDAVEGALKTPVQTAVKREDEQEFARLNGQNLMFCEDAARRLQEALDVMPVLRDFWVRVNHVESLHAHNAVAVVTKSIPGGYPPVA